MKELHYIEADVINEDVKIGTVRIGFALGGVYRPSHTHFVCPSCGSVWGKILLAPDRKARHFPITTPCKAHGGGVFSSRLNDGHGHRFSLAFDNAVLTHDFVVMYDWVDGLVKPEELAVSPSEEDWTIPLGAGDKKVL